MLLTCLSKDIWVLLSIMNNIILNIRVQIILPFSILSGIWLGWNCWVTWSLCFTFWGTGQLFQSVCIMLHSHQQGRRLPVIFSPFSSHAIRILDITDFAVLVLNYFLIPFHLCVSLGELGVCFVYPGTPGLSMREADWACGMGSRDVCVPFCSS